MLFVRFGLLLTLLKGLFDVPADKVGHATDESDAERFYQRDCSTSGLKGFSRPNYFLETPVLLKIIK